MSGRFTGGTPLWLTAAAMLSGVIALEVTNELPLALSVEAALSATSTVETMAHDQPVVDLPSSDLIEDIAARPLFSQSRRPLARAADRRPAVPVTAIGTPALELIGTMLAEDAEVALLKQQDGGLIRARLGQSVDGWEIGDIADHEVRLENGDEVHVLMLRKDVIQRPPPRRDRTGGTAAAGPIDDARKPATSVSPSAQ